jgi:Peptidase family M13
MSSPVRGGHQSAFQGPSTSAEQPASKQQKRPTSLGRHSSSWVNRLHRHHHDRKHHRPDDDAERPLLSNDSPNEEEDEEEEKQAHVRPRPSSGEVDRLLRFWSATKHYLKKGYKVPRRSLARNIKYILIACLLALLTLLVSVCVGFFVHNKDEKKLSICQSAACVHAASAILYSLDPNHANLDACTQFDKMVCGGWRQRHDLRPDQGDIFTGTIMAENSKTILRHILEQTSSLLLSRADHDIFKKLKDDYDSCTNEQELERIGLKPLQGIVDHIKMSFPTTLDSAGQSPFPKLEPRAQKGVVFDGSNKLTETLLLLMKLDISTFLTFSVQVSITSMPVQPPRRRQENMLTSEPNRPMTATRRAKS